LKRCNAYGIHLVVVLGDPAYYTKFGFRRASDFKLSNEYQVDEHFMVIGLKPGALENISGIVKNAPEFKDAGC
jgi:putative acetyltransferase